MPRAKGDASPFLETLDNKIESLQQDVSSAEIIVLGDFNVHHAEWLSSANTDNAGVDVEAFALTNNLTQLVSQRTRIPDRQRDAQNILDLFLTSTPHIYHSTNVEAPIGNSDHCLVTASNPIRFKLKTKPMARTLWKLKSADWDGLRSFYGSLP